jgi:hypothetical protein
LLLAHLERARERAGVDQQPSAEDLEWLARMDARDEALGYDPPPAVRITDEDIVTVLGCCG